MDTLLVTWDAGGNVPPMLGLGRALVRHGHRVRCLGPEALHVAVEDAGVTFQPLTRGAAFDPRAPLPLEQSQQAQGRVFFDEGYASDLRNEIERQRPDVVIIDCFLVAAQAAAEAVGVPFALLVHTAPAWFTQFWNHVLLAPTNAMRTRMGLPPARSTAALWARADRVLVASTPLLDVPSPGLQALSGLRYVGPIFEPGDATDLPVELMGEGTGSRVLVSFSTTSMDQEAVLGRVVAALGMLPVRALVTTGPAVDPALLPVSHNVSVHRWLPHAALLRHTALLVTHGGHSTVVKALADGIPLLCMPLGRDQSFLAERIQDLGAGLVLSPDAEPPIIADTIRMLLDTPGYREAARRAAATIRAAGAGTASAVSELEATAFRRPWPTRRVARESAN